MLNTTSWHTFAIICLILIAVYYTFLLAVTYRNKAVKTSPDNNEVNLADHGSGSNDKEFDSASNLKTSIHEIFTLASSRKWQKEEIFSGLASRLQIYSHLQNTPYQYAIENYIMKEAVDHLQMQIAQEEVSRLW